MKTLERIVPRITLGLAIVGSAYLIENCAAAPAIIHFSEAIATACAVEYGVGNRDYEQCLLKEGHPSYRK